MRLDPQVCPEQLPRDVQVLRVLQRLAEHWIDALRSCALDIPEQQRRVRVQSHYLMTLFRLATRKPVPGGLEWSALFLFCSCVFGNSCILYCVRNASTRIHRSVSARRKSESRLGFDEL